MANYVMVIDQKRCIGCMACVVACKQENGVPAEHFRTRVIEEVSGRYPNLRMELRPELCNHCDNPPCVYNCPTRASHKEDDGSVQVNRKRCVGCKACVAACPYDARYMHPEKGFADKCTFCQHRVSRGEEPACVSTCLGKARIFGDLDDPDSMVSKLLYRKDSRVLRKSLGTNPKVFYINKFCKAV